MVRKDRIGNHINRRNHFNRQIKKEIAKGSSINEIMRKSRDLGVGASRKGVEQFLSKGISDRQLSNWLDNRAQTKSTSYRVPSFLLESDVPKNVITATIRGKDPLSGKLKYASVVQAFDPKTPYSEIRDSLLEEGKGLLEKSFEIGNLDIDFRFFDGRIV